MVMLLSRITVIKESNTRYRLTGINIIVPKACDPYHFPDNPALARIGGKKNAPYDERKFTPFYAAQFNKRPAQYRGKLLGFIVHANCWVLFGRVLEPGPTGIKLAKFIRASRRYWRDNKLDGMYDYNINWAEPRQPLPELDYECDIFQNPLVPAVQKAIDHAKNENHRLYPYFDRVPMEIAIMISEWVCPIKYTEDDIRNMRNTLLAFHWKLPDLFWRARLDEDLFSELGMLDDATAPLNLQSLRLDLMSLVLDPTWYNSSGLANRKRVLGIMVGIKKAYLEQT
ncbi:uncharacterized protein N7459_001563 [Penicillium hispanicum]|uniref:uncharacterized protein n=1 Tax=Penicillium hispanicum TaxID=1080232 RepID=UPI0025402BD3|nr:uncharacterized protein N7459_001563 [Penicillium hispanicum]KAJ5595355.1 hypothetical protein N7459_001563 [Penicillium hispanicum]